MSSSIGLVDWMLRRNLTQAQSVASLWLTGWDLNLGAYYSFEESGEGKLFDFKKPYKKKIGMLLGEAEGNWSEGRVRSQSYGPRLEYTPRLFSMPNLETDIRLLLAYRVRFQNAKWNMEEQVESAAPSQNLSARFSLFWSATVNGRGDQGSPSHPAP